MLSDVKFALTNVSTILVGTTQYFIKKKLPDLLNCFGRSTQYPHDLHILPVELQSREAIGTWAL